MHEQLVISSDTIHMFSTDLLVAPSTFVNYLGNTEQHSNLP